MNLNTTQRVTGAITLVFLAWFVAETATLYNRKQNSATTAAKPTETKPTPPVEEALAKPKSAWTIPIDSFRQPSAL